MIHPTIKWACFHSLTVAVTYFLAAVGIVMEGLAQFPDVAAQYNLAQYVPPQYLGYYTWAVAAIVFLSRLRGVYQVFEETEHAHDDSRHGPGAGISDHDRV